MIYDISECRSLTRYINLTLKSMVHEGDWVGMSADLQIVQIMLVEGHNLKEIQDYIENYSPESTNKLPESNKRYAQEIIKKTLLLQLLFARKERDIYCIRKNTSY